MLGPSFRNVALNRCKFLHTFSSLSQSQGAFSSSGQKSPEEEGSSASQESRDRGFYSSSKETHFGFQTVSEEEKAHKVRNVFDNVADKYDVMNDFMSGGVHRLWKDMFVHRLNPLDNMKIVDVAGGTGDIAFRMLRFQNEKRLFNQPIGPFEFPLQNLPSRKKPENEVEAQYQVMEEAGETAGTKADGGRTVLVCDINPNMLEVGKRRAKSTLTLDEQKRISWMEGNAENLDKIPDNTFDAYTIAYGIRNVVRPAKALAEAYRVLKPGGRFLCLEFSQVENPLVKWVYDQYSFQVIPAMGQVLAGDFDSYKYLVESIRKFPKQEEFKSMIEEAGFRFVTYENLMFGMSAIHSGYKL